MNQPHPIGDPPELAALYVSGAMTGAEFAEYQRHVQSGCAACAAELRLLDAAADALAEAAGTAAPPANVRAALLTRAAADTAPHDSHASSDPRVFHRWQPDSTGDLFIQRASEGAWEGTGVGGVMVRRLFVDQARNQFTALVRMTPGAAYPRHIHNGPEECLVLEGDLHVGDDVLLAGDYQRAPAGSRHGIQHTESGCLLLITSSLSDELI
ncbi:MAG TPA: cupin domain-containing protein [Phycisphaerae bacterium]|jgi:anti-sigma factor ChrR (cupin superfamily)